MTSNMERERPARDKLQMEVMAPLYACEEQI